MQKKELLSRISEVTQPERISGGFRYMKSPYGEYVNFQSGEVLSRLDWCVCIADAYLEDEGLDRGVFYHHSDDQQIEQYEPGKQRLVILKKQKPLVFSLEKGGKPRIMEATTQNYIIIE
jgi:hypothetical protein